MKNVPLDPSWQNALETELNAPYMHDLEQFLLTEKQLGKTIFPKRSEYFNALNLTPLQNVKIVILGQDPYHGEGQAHGLSFSVKPEVKIPPSLRNIYKELSDDIGFAPPPHGYLESWAREGVLLLNTVLSVEQGQPASHQGQGWEKFTDTIIQTINQKEDPVVFMLWGSHAHKKDVYINQEKHLILKSTHPSPLSAHRGFLGCRHFSQANAFLKSHRRQPIDWALPIEIKTA